MFENDPNIEENKCDTAKCTIMGGAMSSMISGWSAIACGASKGGVIAAGVAGAIAPSLCLLGIFACGPKIRDCINSYEIEQENKPLVSNLSL